MEQTTIQIRVSEELKKEATKVFERYFLDLSTAIRLFLAKATLINGFPFVLTDEDNFLASMYFGDRYDDDGKLGVTLKEINDEIKKAREDMDKRYKLVKDTINKK